MGVLISATKSLFFLTELLSALLSQNGRMAALRSKAKLLLEVKETKQLHSFS
jgi:hypothetical protein